MAVWNIHYFSLVIFWLSLVQGSSYVEREVTIGGDVTLPCTVDFSGVSPQVMWLDPNSSPLTRNEEVITTDERFSINHPYHSEWNLKITGVKTNDEGNFTCMIQSNPIQHKKVLLRIVSAPSIISSSEDMEIRTGSDVTFQCEAQGPPSPVISWYKYTNVDDSQELGVQGDNLTLTNVSRHDAATYECEADNGVPPAAKSLIRLDVMFSPVMSLPHQYISQEEGHDTFLQCDVTTHPYGTIHWEYDGKILAESDKYQLVLRDMGHYNKTLLLSIQNLLESDFGTYTCVSKNDFGSDRADMELREWQSGHVRVVAPPEDAISNEGLDVVINCTVEQMGHEDILAWWKYERGVGFVRIFESHPTAKSKSASRQPVYMNADKYGIIGHYNLLIKNVSLADGGEYMCEIVGRNNHSAFITVVDQLVCQEESNITIINEGAFAKLACGMQFSGPIQLWHAIWRRDNLTLSSIDEDLGDRIHRTVTFPVLASDSGIYLCAISNQKPPYYSQCETQIDVVGHDPDAAPLCKSNPWNMATSDIAIIIAGSLGGLILIFSLILMGVCCHFKKQLKSTRSPESSPLKRNGEVNLETSRLTATEANEHEV